MDWKGKRVVIMGAARQGTALAQYLDAQGAKVLLSDARDAAYFAEIQERLKDTKIEWRFGEQTLDLLKRAKLLSISGGVSPEHPLVQAALKKSIPLTNDSQIFLEVAPCPVVGITGSAGKTTTTMLVGRMLSALKHREGAKAWTGGNIGNPLIALVDKMTFADIAVMELSSFQLEIMDRAPQIAALLNLAPNHLDRHATMADYVAAKARIFDFQREDDIAVLNREDRGARSMAGRVKSLLWTFGRERQEDERPGTYLVGKDIWLRDAEGESKLMPIAAISLRGEHNLLNVLAACCIAAAAGARREDIVAGVEAFTGAPHRLELVRTIDGVDWYNDSIATSPQRAEASLKSFDRPVVLLAGGRDKALNWENYAQLAGEKARKVLAFGEAANLVFEVFSKSQPRDSNVDLFAKMEDAIEAAHEIAREGEVVLLAPGGTSFDEFADFEARGQRFRELVEGL